MASSSHRHEAQSPSLSPSMSLREAILTKNRPEVYRLLADERVDPNQGEYSFTPEDDEAEDIPRLVGLTPIHLAVIKANDKILRILLDFKWVDINMKTGKPYQLTSLELAALLDKKDCIKLLIERGAQFPDKSLLKPNISRDDSIFDQKTTEVLSLLYRVKGLIGSVARNSGRLLFNNSFDSIEAKHCREVAAESLRNRLRDWHSFNPLKGGNKTSFLHHLCSKGLVTEKLLVALLDYDLNINARDEKGKTASHITAIRMISFRELSILLKHGVNLSLRDNDGDTLLMEGLTSQFCFTPDMLKQLAPNDEALHAMNHKTGDNALSLTVKRKGTNDRLEFIRYLLDKGADIHHKLTNGKSLLHLAAEFGASIGTIKFLAQKGVEPSICLFTYIFDNKLRPKDKTYLLEYALKRGLKPRVEDLNNALMCDALTLVSPEALTHLSSYWYIHAMPSKHYQTSIDYIDDKPLFVPLMKRFIEDFNFDPNYRDKSHAFLIELIRNQPEEFVIKCLEYMLASNDFHLNVDVTISGETPLSVSVQNGYYKVAKLLIFNFANVNLVSLVPLRVQKLGQFYECSKILFYSGYEFNGDYETNFRHSREAEGTINHFKAWLKEKRCQVFSLQRLAGIVVRKVYGKEVRDILEEGEFSREVVDILFLKTIEA